MKCIGIIPARYASTRFPGKPLVDIGGKPMIQRVYEQALKALETVYIATDDDRILKKVESFGGKAVMTSLSHTSGTDRCMEALNIIQSKEKIKYDAVINIQGDEPFIQPESLQILISVFQKPAVQLATLCKKITNNDELFDPNVVKILFDKNKKALYFSRSPLPFIAKVKKEDWINRHDYYKHFGIYGYTQAALEQITKLTPSVLEKAESLEQLRWIENGFPIHVEISNHESISIDTPEDIEKIKRMGWIE